jgi:hypothetical protein
MRPSLRSVRLCDPASEQAGLTARWLSTGGPYAIFAGRDASRGLAKQSFEAEMLTPVDEPIDKLEDLSASEWENLRDWEGEECALRRFRERQRSFGADSLPSRHSFRSNRPLQQQVHPVRVSQDCSLTLLMTR